MSRNISFQSNIQGDVVEPFFAVDLDFSPSISRTFYITVLSTGEGNRYAIDDVQGYYLAVAKGNTIILDQSDPSNANHPIALATSLDGTTYSTGVTITGSPGTDGKLTWQVAASTPDTLYYKCSNHSGMGGNEGISIAMSALRLWTGYGETTIDGNIFTGSGDLGTIGAVEQTEKLEARGVKLTISGIPTNIITEAMSQQYFGRQAIIYFGVLTNGQVSLVPYKLFNGFMNVMSITQSGQSSTVSLDCENYLVNLKRSNILRYTDEDQKALHSSDESLRFIVALQNKEVLWGVPYSAVGNTVGARAPSNYDELIKNIQNITYT
tara:strand:- start:12560 stop:13528 length:969 start_codon:yes stop_codon:yes gene_type:complete